MTSCRLYLNSMFCLLAASVACRAGTLPDVYTHRTSEATRLGAIRRHGGAPAVELCVRRALDWLVTQQQPDGSWLETKPAMTGFALLAFLGHGEDPSSPTYGTAVRSGIAWLLAQQEPSGLFAGRDAHNYSHAIATMALCEAYAFAPSPELRVACENALRVIVNGQNPGGGWNYNYDGIDRDDTSFMVWCVHAIKAGQVAGISLPGTDSVLDRAVEGFRGNAHPAGGFGYIDPRRTALTGAAVKALQYMGAASLPETAGGFRWLDEYATCNWESGWGSFALYNWNLCTEALHHRGGRLWAKWHDMLVPTLVRAQQADGHWDVPAGSREASRGAVYSTALCTFMLESYYRFATKPGRALDD